MKLLFVIHYCSPDVNDNALGPLYLGTAGHEVLVISSRYAKSLKGEVWASEREVIGRTEFYRPYREWLDITNNPWSRWDDVVRRVDEFQPEVVVGFGEFNYKLSLALSKRYSIPYVLYVEYLNPLKFAIPVKGKTLLKNHAPALYRMLSNLFLSYLKKRVSAIMYAYSGDGEYAEKLKQTYGEVHYVPWCTDMGGVECRQKSPLAVGIYIGSLEPFKNSGQLLDMIPTLLENTKTEKFIVIGPGSLAVRAKQLEKRFGKRFEYRESVTREEALELIGSASYGFTTVRDCGLGFIGDCWGSMTPLISMYDLDGFLKDGEDCLVAGSEDVLLKHVDRVLESRELADRLALNGKSRHEKNYTAKAVGEEYLKVINAVINKHQRTV